MQVIKENFTVLRVLLLLCLAHEDKFLSIPYSSEKNKFLPEKFLALFYYFPLMIFTTVLILIKEYLG